MIQLTEIEGTGYACCTSASGAPPSAASRHRSARRSPRSPTSSRAFTSRCRRRRASRALHVLLVDLRDFRIDRAARLRALLRGVRDEHARPAAPGARQFAPHRPAVRAAAARRSCPTVGTRERAARPAASARSRRNSSSWLPTFGTGCEGSSNARSVTSPRRRSRLARRVGRARGHRDLDADSARAETSRATRFTPRARDGERLRILSQVREAIAGSLRSHRGRRAGSRR